MLVTMIVPVYNVEKYLDRCIKTIVNQTWKDYEVILVDDGSTDNSGVMCDDYAIIYPFIKVIHKENGGLSSARNAGIEVAKGEYVTFVDSDDYISKYYVENLVSALEKSGSDLAVSLFVNVYDGDESIADKEQHGLTNLRTRTNEACLKDMLYQKVIDTSACGKLYSLKAIGELRFPHGKLYEDIMFTTTMLARAKQIAIVDNIDYFYYQRVGSIQYQTFNERKLDCIRQFHKQMEFIDHNFPPLCDAVRARYFSGVCNILFQIPEGKYEDIRKNLWKELKECRKYVLFNSNVRLKSRVAGFLSFLGHDVLKSVYKYTQARGKFHN